ncbi:IS4/IS5 family transposase [Streptomyces koyangensis]|uniref:IS4/IS5 family transposase n=1 Tax=Streptomyces koyangensis TaxID=188770 RepID=A0A385D584_9ACTN|nr:IS4/IS5 family transposase [Streptomyces koyangensis]
MRCGSTATRCTSPTSRPPTSAVATSQPPPSRTDPLTPRTFPVRALVGVPAPGAGLRLGDDGLAAPARLERSRCLGCTGPGAAEEVAGREEARLVPGGDRLLPPPGRLARPKSGPSPVDCARPGSKRHVLTDGQCIPLAVSLTGGNRNDVTQLLPLLDKVPAVAGTVGRLRHRPDALLADRGYDHDKYRCLLRQRGIRPVIAETRRRARLRGLAPTEWTPVRVVMRRVSG